MSMIRRSLRPCFVALGVAALGLAATGSTSLVVPEAPRPAQAQAQVDYARLPLGFSVSEGGGADFVAAGPGFKLRLAPDEVVVALGAGAPGSAPSGPVRSAISGTAQSSVLSMRLAGADAAAEPVPQRTLPGTASYLHGDDPSRWRSGLPTYEQVV